MTDIPAEPVIRKRPGRPPNPAKVQAAAQPKRGYTRQATRQEPRETARETVNENSIVRGREGEILSRKRKAIGDMWDTIPKSKWPVGWEYQWNTYTVVNEQATDAQLIMHENGFRPVPASRYPGQFMPHGYEGPIIRGGLRLEERPEQLGIQAREEEYAKARGQMRDQTDSLRLTEKMPKGFEAQSRKYRGTEARVKMSIDPALDIPAPRYQDADDSVA